MRALFPEERAAILELHPGRKEEELDRFEDLLHAALSSRGRERPALVEVEETEARLFPRFAEALELAAQRRDPAYSGDLPVA